MNKIYREWLCLLALSALLGACSSVPTHRVHAAATVPRFVDVPSAGFGEGERAGSHFGGNLGAGYGVAYSDVGNVHGGEVFHAGVHFREEHFAVGWMPYYASAQVSHEGTGGFGSVFWAAAHFGGGHQWLFSYQNTLALVDKTAEDSGCEKDYALFGSQCQNQAVSVTNAEVRVRDVGFLLTAEHRLKDSTSLLLVPGVYWTEVFTGNHFDLDPSGNYSYHATSWNPSFQVGYVIRLEGAHPTAVVLMAGAQWVKTFRPDRAVRQLMPTADLRWQF